MDLMFFERLKGICPDTVADEPMYKHTTFRIGGNADYFTTPDSVAQMQEIIKICKEENIPYTVIGNGSNLLVSDNGIEGVVICISDLPGKVEIDGTTVTAGAGILLSRLSRVIAGEELSGMEGGSGIPGTLGGAVYMNAGAYGFEMKNIVKKVTYIDEEGEIKEASGDELDFGYRKSMFSGRNCIIISAQMDFEKSELESINTLMSEYTFKRNDKQPVNMPSAGSVFKRPEGYFAGALIEEAGLKGFRIGGAEVSRKHAGFIVNAGGATAKDVTDLIEHIIKTVKERSGVVLEPEIKLIGRK